MKGQDFENLVVIREPCPNPTCYVGRHYHHYIEDYYFCDCGWKIAGENFIPAAYQGDDWDAKNECFSEDCEIIDDPKD